MSGRRPATAADLRKPSRATALPDFVSFCASILMKPRSRSGKNCTTSFCPPRSGADCSICCACSSATSSSSRCCAFCAALISSSDLRTCCGTSQMCVENTAAASVSVSKSRRAVRDRAQSADELHAHALLHFFGLAQQDAANLTGAAHVCSAAGVQIEVANIDQAQLVALVPAGILRTPSVRASSAVAKRISTGSIFGDDLGSRAPRQPSSCLRGDRSRGEVDGAALVAHVEGNRRKVVQLFECRRQHMLARVLLHVIETPLGVDETVHDRSPAASARHFPRHAALLRYAHPRRRLSPERANHQPPASRCRRPVRRWWDKKPSGRA